MVMVRISLFFGFLNLLLLLGVYSETAPKTTVNHIRVDNDLDCHITDKDEDGREFFIFYFLKFITIIRYVQWVDVND